MEWNERFDANYPWRFLPGWQNKVPLKVILSDVFFQAPVAYIPPPEILTFTHENCPGRCKRTGKCYAYSYFMHKAGKPVPCAKKACEWVERLNDAMKTKQAFASSCGLN